MDAQIQKLGADDVELAKQLLQLFHAACFEEDGVTMRALPEHKYLRRLLARDDFHAIVAMRQGEIVI